MEVEAPRESDKVSCFRYARPFLLTRRKDWFDWKSTSLEQI